MSFVYVVDVNEFAVMNEVRAEVFRVKPPGRTTLAVSALPTGTRVEITVTALVYRSSENLLENPADAAPG
jgi:2-iminobutanoate/2-iminopropanoate deaminase